MTVSLSRYFKREKIEAHCLTITPMFLGNASQEAELRTAPFKALLRYWWRVTQHHQRDRRVLLEKESELFGSAGDSNGEGGGKSTVGVKVFPVNMKSSEKNLPAVAPIVHPEFKRDGGKIDPLLYLANMGIMGTGGFVKHSYFPPESLFIWFIEYPEYVRDNLKPVLALIQAFGAIGARCRNGWGSFQIEAEIIAKAEGESLLTDCTIEWIHGFDKDYPNSLGRDEKGALLWKTSMKGTWGEVMRDLADTYVAIRAREVGGIGKLDADGQDFPSERHLLGFPLTHHPASKREGWGNKGRHASPIRFNVRRKGAGFQGFILHLPHRFSNEMNHPFGKPDQIKVWEKVHRKLDYLLKRAQYRECL